MMHFPPGDDVGAFVGLLVGLAFLVGKAVGVLVGRAVMTGLFVGDMVGLALGASVGEADGLTVGEFDGEGVGLLLGDCDGEYVGLNVGDFVGVGFAAASDESRFLLLMKMKMAIRTTIECNILFILQSKSGINNNEPKKSRCY